MRHLLSALLALLVAPLVWALSGVGLALGDRATSGDPASGDPAAEAWLGLALLLVAGALYAVLVVPRLSPVGPVLAGLVLLGLAVWSLADRRSFLDVTPRRFLGEDFALTLPAGTLAALLAVPLLATALSPRRWRRRERPVPVRAPGDAAALGGAASTGFPPTGFPPGGPGYAPAGNRFAPAGPYGARGDDAATTTRLQAGYPTPAGFRAVTRHPPASTPPAGTPAPPRAAPVSGAPGSAPPTSPAPAPAPPEPESVTTRLPTAVPVSDADDATRRLDDLIRQLPDAKRPAERRLTDDATRPLRPPVDYPPPAPSTETHPPVDPEATTRL